MKKQRFFYGFLLPMTVMASLFFSCQRSLHEPPFMEIIPVAPTLREGKQGTPPPMFTDYFKLEGYCALKGVEDRIAFDIRKLIRHGNTLVAYVNRGDFQHVCLFDAVSGQFIRYIGRNSEQGDGYKCLRDIDIRNGEIVLLNSGDMEFMHYDFDGRLLRTLKNGVFGDNLHLAADGSYWVYNEHNESEVSEYFYLLRFDREGNLTDRILPYPKKANLQILDYTGELSKNGDQIWVNLPFSDTLFELNTNTRQLVPAYVLNPPNAMSIADKERAKKGAIPENLRYMDYHFAPMADGLLYAWVDATDVHPMYFDKRNGTNISLPAGKETGGINELVARVYNIHPIDNERVMLRVPHGALQAIMKAERWEQGFADYPGLADEIRYGAANRMPLVLTFSAKKL